MTAVRHLVVRHHGLHRVDDESVHRSLEAIGITGLMSDVEIDSHRFRDAIDGGEWATSDIAVWEAARTVRQTADTIGGIDLAYFGMPEVPHAIMFGAYLGSDRYISVYPYNTTDGTWTWPSVHGTLAVETDNCPTDSSLAPGAAILRVGISAVIDDESVRLAVGEHAIADVTIRPRNETPSPGTALVRSRADAEVVREAARKAIDCILAARPRTTVLHLFVAAPVPVCVLIGQVLAPHNLVPVQTYRYRVQEGVGRHSMAGRITAEGPVRSDPPVTDAERARAAEIRRTEWPQAIEQLTRYRAFRLSQSSDGPWYEALAPAGAWNKSKPFPRLPSFDEVCPEAMDVDQEPYERDGFAYDPIRRLWRLSDGLLVRIDAAFGSDPNALHAALRLFMFHEIVHSHHSIAKGSVAEVGKFPNALEHVDYTADLYAIAHELDYRIRNGWSLESPDAARAELRVLVDTIIRSFWTFDSRNPRGEMEVRRIRRYLNWYWQLVRVGRADTFTRAAAALSRKPIVEIAGTLTRSYGRRHYASLLRRDPDVGLEMALVTDDDGLHRIPDSALVRVVSILEALNQGDHHRLVVEFSSVFESAEHAHAALPSC